MNYLEEIKREFPNIRAGWEDDFDWDFDGDNFIKSDDLKNAEIIFKKLTLSQPEHHSGFEGLANVYVNLNNKEKAIFFMNIALEKGKSFLKNNAIDIDVIEEMEDRLREINNM